MPEVWGKIVNIAIQEKFVFLYLRNVPITLRATVRKDDH